MILFLKSDEKLHKRSSSTPQIDFRNETSVYSRKLCKLLINTVLLFFFSLDTSYNVLIFSTLSRRCVAESCVTMHEKSFWTFGWIK